MKATIYDGKTVREYSESDSSVLAPDTPYAWVDVAAQNLEDPQVKALLTDLGLDSPVLAYLRQQSLAGTFRIVGSRVVGSTWAAPDTAGGKPVYVHVVWSSGSIVTLRNGGDKAMASVLDQVTDLGPGLFTSPSIVPGVLLDLILSSVDRRLNDIGDDIDRIDEQIMVDSKGNQVAQLRTLRDEIAPWSRRLPLYQQNLKVALVDPSDIPGMDSNGIHYLQAYESHVGGTVNTVEDLLDSLHSTVQDYQAELSNRQGNRINQLTVVATIFLPITFMTGYFGMNFQWLSDATMSFGSWILLGVLLPVCLLLGSVLLLRRRGFGAWLLGTSTPNPGSAHTKRVRAGQGTSGEGSATQP